MQASYSFQYIKNLMKTQSKLKFKWGKSRTCNIDFEKLSLIRHLFSIIFTKQMTMDALLVNIDEWSINRNTKLKYSWRFKGVHIESQNTLFRRSISIVLTIYSNGSFISFAINETINSENFMWFLSIMKQLAWNIKNNFEY